MLKQPIQEHQIVELLQIYYGIDVQVAEFLPGGADMNASVYKADAKSNSYFIKLKHGLHDEINLSIIRLLHNSGINEILFPIYSLNGKLFEQIGNVKIIVYPFIDAPNGFTQVLTEKQWKQLGHALKNVHSTSVPLSIQQQLRKETYLTKWRNSVKSFFTQIDPDESDDQITADFKSFFNKNIDIIHQLVKSADDLSRKIQPDPEKYVLCHSDIHAGNVLLANESIYIIDWDEPMMAPKERDLMFIGAGVGNVWNKPHEISYFYQGYGKTDIDITILSYYRLERIIEDIAVYASDLLSHVKNNQVRSVMFNHFKSMFDSNGVVEIAFATNQSN